MEEKAESRKIIRHGNSWRGLWPQPKSEVCSTIYREELAVGAEKNLPDTISVVSNSPSGAALGAGRNEDC